MRRLTQLLRLNKADRWALSFFLFILLCVISYRYYQLPQSSEQQTTRNRINSNDSIVNTSKHHYADSAQQQSSPKRKQIKQAPRHIPQYRKNETEIPKDKVRKNKKNYPAYVSTKFRKDTVISLNQADTTLLMRVPGIGPTYANRIVKYRALLNGFASITQLQEVYGLEDKYEELLQWFECHPSEVIPIKVKVANKTDLSSHPYISYQQASIIVNLRNRKGKLENLAELSLYPEFNDSVCAKLAPYIEF